MVFEITIFVLGLAIGSVLGNVVATLETEKEDFYTDIKTTDRGENGKNDTR